ncbi:hypothetical protein DICA2_C15412 [Diutina catenulata]
METASVIGYTTTKTTDCVFGFSVSFAPECDDEVYEDASTGWEELGSCQFSSPRVTHLTTFMAGAVAVSLAGIAASVTTGLSLSRQLVEVIMAAYFCGLSFLWTRAGDIKDPQLLFSLACYMCVVHETIALYYAQVSPGAFVAGYVGCLATVFFMATQFLRTRRHMDAVLVVGLVSTGCCVLPWLVNPVAASFATPTLAHYPFTTIVL